MSEPSTPAPAAPAPAPEATPQQETFTLDYVQELRQEAANYRLKAKNSADEARAAVIKEYEGKLSDATSKHAELETTAAADALELLKLKAVLAAKVPTDDILEVAALIQGNDEASISESVERVKNLLGKAPANVPAIDSTQGTGGAVPLNGNPVLDILTRAVQGRR